MVLEPQAKRPRTQEPEAAPAKAKRSVAVIGAGSFGTAVARVVGAAVANSANFVGPVRLWARRPELVEAINSSRENVQYLPGAKLPETVVATSSLAEAAAADVHILAVPHQHLESVLSEMPATSSVQVSLIKGVYFRGGELLRVSSVVQKARSGPFAFLAGPNLYADMADNLWAEATLACGETEKALLSELFSTSNFTVEWTPDVRGAEMLSVLKNCFSLGCGMMEGLGNRMNGRVAFLRRGLMEARQFLREFQEGSEDTCWQACGFGDLVLTGLGGRGRSVAAEFVKRGGGASWADLEAEMLSGMQLPDTVNLRAVTAFIRARGSTNFPILEQVHRVAFEGAPAASLVECLRRPKPVGNLPTTDLRQQLCLVTGGRGGIGRAVCEHLRDCNARVVCLDMGDVDSFVKEIGIYAGFSADLLDVDAMMAKIKEFMTMHGPISLLVNCAGVLKFEPIFSTSPSEFDRQYAVNVKAPMFLTQVIAQRCNELGLPGSVVHISSQSSTLPLKDHLVYSSSKAALDHAARIQAFELGAQGMRVNTVRPTVVMTPMVSKGWDPTELEKMKKSIPLQDVATPVDVAEAVAWLLSDKSRLVTGSTLAVDGGRSMGGFGL